MSKSTSTFVSILSLKCPRCHEGNLFIYPNSFSYKKMIMMPDECPVCGLKFEPEPGFYWGAMYIGYGLSVAFSVFNFLWMYLIWGWLTWQFITVNAILLAIAVPYTFRFSRCIYIYIIQSFESKEKKIL